MRSPTCQCPDGSEDEQRGQPDQDRPRHALKDPEPARGLVAHPIREVMNRQPSRHSVVGEILLGGVIGAAEHVVRRGGAEYVPVWPGDPTTHQPAARWWSAHIV